MNRFDITLEETGRELMPCPFCGGAATLEHTWTASYWIECSQCDAKRDDQLNECLDDESHADHLRSAKAACAAWNDRAEMNCNPDADMLIARWNSAVGHWDREVQLIQLMRELGLTSTQILSALTAIASTCNHCWNGRPNCKCWNDE